MTGNPFSTLIIRIMRPVVRLLMRFGIPYKACTEAIKWCYVDVATHDFAVDGQQTKSRVAVITGLTRIEVEKLQREAPPAAHDNARSHHRAARVLTGWASDPLYLDADGRPIALPVDGPAPSFAALVTDYSGGTTVRAVLDESLRVGAVQRIQPDQVALVQADFIAVEDGDQTQALAIMGLSGHDLLGTIERNLRPGQADRYLQRLVQQVGLKQSQVAAARQYIRRKSLQLLEDVDLFLARLAREQAATTDAAEPVDADPVVERLGVGLYYFQDEPAPPAINHDRRGRKTARTRSRQSQEAAADLAAPK